MRVKVCRSRQIQKEMRLLLRKVCFIMKSPRRIPAAALWLFTSTLALTAQDARFFRVTGPVPVMITAISASG